MQDPEPGAKINFMAAALQGLEPSPDIDGVPLNCIARRMTGCARSIRVREVWWVVKKIPGDFKVTHKKLSNS